MAKLDPDDIDRIVALINNTYISTSSVKPKKRGFTDRMYMFNIYLVSTILILSFALMFLSAFVAHIDLSPVSSIVMAAFAELGLHTGFIIWKAKTENMHKYPDIMNMNETI